MEERGKHERWVNRETARYYQAPFTGTSSVSGPFGDTEIRVKPMGKGKSAARHTVPSDERTGYFSFARRRDVVPIAWKRSGPQLF